MVSGVMSTVRGFSGTAVDGGWIHVLADSDSSANLVPLVRRASFVSSGPFANSAFGLCVPGGR